MNKEIDFNDKSWAKAPLLYSYYPPAKAGGNSAKAGGNSGKAGGNSDQGRGNSDQRKKPSTDLRR